MYQNFYKHTQNNTNKAYSFQINSQKLVVASLAILFALFTGQVMAQNPVGILTGKVSDAKGEAIPFATILLVKSQDSSMVKGALTDMEGNFSVEKISKGNYLVSIRMMGYENYYTPVIEITNEIPVVLPPIQLKDASTKLAEVTVTAQKPMIEVKNGTVVMNVATSSILTNGTTFDALSKAPGVSTNQDGKISIKGKQNVIILIDGKQTYLTGEDLTRLLQSTQAANIERIEIIENPSAKYDAAGNAGMINIIMKRAANEGLNGTITLGSGYGTAPKANTGLTLNYKKNKVSLFATYDYTWAETAGTIRLYRKAPVTPTEFTLFNQFSRRNSSTKASNFRIGGEYYVGKKTTIGFLMTGNIGESGRKVIGESNLSGYTTTPYTQAITEGMTNFDWKNGSANINFKHTFAKGELTADADYSSWTRTGKQNLPTHFYKNNEEVINSFIQNGVATTTDMKIKALKIDYSLPLENGLKLDMGVKTSSVTTSNILDATTKQGTVWVPDASRSNTFMYDENINAAYFNMGKKLGKKWNLQGGLRLEHTVLEGYSATLNQRNSQNYVALFPSATITYTPTDTHAFSFLYSRRIDRPTYANLNPFAIYIDQYTYNLGNPFLNAQFTNSLGITYGYANSLFVTANYTHTDGNMIEVLGIDSKQASYQTIANLSIAENYSINVSSPITLTNWWGLNLNVTGYYARNAATQALILERFVYLANITTTISLPHNFKFEATGFYESPTLYSTFEVSPQYRTDIGITKSLLNNQLRLKASLTDVFNTYQFKAHVQQPYVDLVNKWETQVFRLNISYLFGNKDVKATRKRSTASDDLLERANQGGN